MHRNTLRHRIRRAEQLAGRPTGRRGAAARGPKC
ncbi:helix-turn-helix domain-containing protein [Streptomyces sp. NPDC001604]